MAEDAGGGDGGDVEIGKGIKYMSGGGRQRFQVELRPGETTIVSWKKLLKEANKRTNKTTPLDASTSAPLPPQTAAAAAVGGGGPEARVGISPTAGPAENGANDAPPSSRLSSVIEKIERLYMGKNSSDEEDLNDVPYDDDYDTEDSFIDDTELDEYFQVDNSAIKHDGFFVNRGMLERTEPSVVQNQQPRKRRRKDLSKDGGGNEDSRVPKKQMKVNKKAAGNSVPPLGKDPASTSHGVTTPATQLEEVRSQNHIDSSENNATKKSSDTSNMVHPSPSRILNGEGVIVAKDSEKQKAGISQSKGHGNKLKDGTDLSVASTQKSNDKNSQSKSQPVQLVNNPEQLGQSLPRKEKNVAREQSDMKVPDNNQHSAKSPFSERKDGSSVKPRINLLEKAIRELERVVAASRPPKVEVPDGDASSQAVKRRMPPEVKQKLAKVARLAQSSHGKISNELLSRLMSIVGHLIQLRSLKRNLNAMVSMGLSAKQEIAAKVQLKKKEVDEMVKTRVPLLKAKAIEQNAGSPDDFQESASKDKEAQKRYCMDHPLEDKICELYDLFVDGLDEDAGPQVGKLYNELAEMWPKGFMDKQGIKRAILRSKDRKKAANNRIRKRKSPLVTKAEKTTQVEASSTQQMHTSQEKTAPNLSTSSNPTSLKRPLSHPSAEKATAQMPLPPNSSDRPKQEKVKPSTGNPSDGKGTTEGPVKKKVKKNPEMGIGEKRIRPEKVNPGQQEESQKSSKATPSSLQKATPSMAGAVSQPPPPLSNSTNIV